MNHVLYLKIKSRQIKVGEFSIQNLEFFDVLAVLDFVIPYSRPRTPGFHPRPQLTKYDGHDEIEEIRKHKRASKFKDGEKVGVPKSLGPNIKSQNIK